MTVKDRLKAFITFLNISEREFCRVIGVSATYVQTLGNRINRTTLNAMQRAYPMLNIQWLLNGAGEMLLDPQMAIKPSSEVSEAPKAPEGDMASRLLALVESQQKTIAQLTESNNRLTRVVEGYKKASVEAPAIGVPSAVD